MLWASLCDAQVARQQLERPQAVRLRAAEALLRIDGKLDDAAWQRAPVFDAFTQYLPQDKRPVPDGYRTPVQVVVDDTGMSFGLRAFDPWLDEIPVPLARRDQERRDQDFVFALLEPVGTRRSAQFVHINTPDVVDGGMYVADTDTDNKDFSLDFEVDAAKQRLPDGSCLTATARRLQRVNQTALVSAALPAFGRQAVAADRHTQHSARHEHLAGERTVDQRPAELRRAVARN